MYKMEKDLICYFLEMLNQLQVLHWQTESHARHEAYGMAYDNLYKLVDTFIESYQGKYKRIKITGSIELMNIDGDVNQFIDTNIAFLADDLTHAVDEKDFGMIALRDEMITELDMLRYRLTLK
jgi:hypothetical protein